MSTETILVKIGPQGLGRACVPFAPGVIEMVRVREHHGTPHIIPASSPSEAWVEVLGAVPDTEVEVSFHVT